MDINWSDWLLFEHPDFGMRGAEYPSVCIDDLPDIAWRADSMLGTDAEAKEELLDSIKSRLFVNLLKNGIITYSSNDVCVDYIGAVQGVFTVFRATLNPDLTKTPQEEAVALEVANMGGKYIMVHNPVRDIETVINKKRGENIGKVRSTAGKSRASKKSSKT